VARTDRQQRRQRRAEKAGTPPLRPAPRQRPAEEPKAAPAESASVEPSGQGQTEGRGGFRIVRFVREAIAELKKVEWPSQHQTVSGTAVVIVACVITGFYLYVNDRVWSYVVQHVLLR
jgi:preprotein translocase SecE subunit